mmetsp:Transcript_6475/g.22790  ORF Transcript_6475/g.22790 Transcript_6475/m.22790 type:complete len:163 (-) Transcript_6475:2383-2871(-)
MAFAKRPNSAVRIFYGQNTTGWWWGPQTTPLLRTSPTAARHPRGTGTPCSAKEKVERIDTFMSKTRSRVDAPGATRRMFNRLAKTSEKGEFGGLPEPATPSSPKSRTIQDYQSSDSYFARRTIRRSVEKEREEKQKANKRPEHSRFPQVAVGCSDTARSLLP